MQEAALATARRPQNRPQQSPQRAGGISGRNRLQHWPQRAGHKTGRSNRRSAQAAAVAAIGCSTGHSAQVTERRPQLQEAGISSHSIQYDYLIRLTLYELDLTHNLIRYTTLTTISVHLVLIEFTHSLNSITY